MNRMPSVQTKLSRLVLASVIPVTFIAAGLVFNTYLRDRQQAVSASIDRARAISSALDREFARTEASLQTIAATASFADLQRFHFQATQTLPYVRADSIMLLDSDGRLLMSTRHAPTATPPKISAPFLSHPVRSSNRPVISNIVQWTGHRAANGFDRRSSAG